MTYRIVVVIGLMVGFVSLTLTTPVVPHVQITAAENAENDQHPDQQELTVGSFDAITTSVHINFNQDFLLNYILPDLDEDKEETASIDQVIVPGDKALKILFRRIISPNAP